MIIRRSQSKKDWRRRLLGRYNSKSKRPKAGKTWQTGGTDRALWLDYSGQEERVDGDEVDRSQFMCSFLNSENSGSYSKYEESPLELYHPVWQVLPTCGY